MDSLEIYALTTCSCAIWLHTDVRDSAQYYSSQMINRTLPRKKHCTIGTQHLGVVV